MKLFFSNNSILYAWRQLDLSRILLDNGAASTNTSRRLSILAP